MRKALAPAVGESLLGIDLAGLAQRAESAADGRRRVVRPRLPAHAARRRRAGAARSRCCARARTRWLVSASGRVDRASSDAAPRPARCRGSGSKRDVQIVRGERIGGRRAPGGRPSRVAAARGRVARRASRSVVATRDELTLVAPDRASSCGSATAPTFASSSRSRGASCPGSPTRRDYLDVSVRSGRSPAKPSTLRLRLRLRTSTQP